MVTYFLNTHLLSLHNVHVPVIAMSQSMHFVTIIFGGKTEAVVGLVFIMFVPL